MSDQESVNALFGVDAESKTKAAQLPKLSDRSMREIAKEEKRPFYARTSVQLGVACGGFLLGAIFLKSIFFSGDPIVAKVETVAPVQANTVNPYDKLSKENADLRAKLGDRKQQDFVVANATKKNAAPKVNPNNVVAVNRLPVIQRVQSPPQIRTVERVVYRTVPSAAPVYPPRSEPVSLPRFYNAAALPSLNRPPSDPERVIANLGDKIMVDGSSMPVATPAVFNSTSNESSPYPIAQLPDSESRYPSPSDTPPVAMNTQTLSSIPSGTEGRGELLVPVIAPKGMDISSDEFPVKVTKAIGSIPKGATLMVTTDASGSDAGFFRFKVSRAFNDGQNLDVPENLTVCSEDGSPLIKARIKRPGSEFGLKDLVSPLFSALRGVASNAIAGNSSTITSNGYSSYSSTSQRNPFAAAGAGLADGILGNAQNRASQAQTSQSPYSMIPNGTEFKLVAR